MMSIKGRRLIKYKAGSLNKLIGKTLARLIKNIKVKLKVNNIMNKNGR